MSEGKFVTVRNVENNIHKKWKIACAILGISMTDFAIQAVEEKLERMKHVIQPVMENTFKVKESI